MKNITEQIGFYWNIFISVTVTILAVKIPLYLLAPDYFGEVNYVSDWIIQVIFLLDIAFEFGRIKRKEDLNPLHFAHVNKGSYLKTFFTLDVIAALPLWLFTGVTGFALLRLLKLVKVGWFMVRLRRMQINYSNILSLFFFFYWMSIVAHWMGCAWFAIRIKETGGYFWDSYITSIYWITTTLTTVGYGDITPQTNVEKIFTIFVEMIGIGIYSYLIGNVAGIISKKDPAKAQYLEDMEKLSFLVRYRKIPGALQKRVRDFYTYRWKKKMGYSEGEFLDSLPEGLKTDVAEHLKKEVVESIDLFKDGDKDFLRNISIHLKPIILTPGDYVFKAGDQGQRMYFVVQGELVVISPDGKIIATLNNGDFFGEIALFMNTHRTATIQALSYCDLYYLDKEKFDYVLKRYKDIAAEIEKKARARFNTIPC